MWSIFALKNGCQRAAWWLSSRNLSFMNVFSFFLIFGKVLSLEPRPHFNVVTRDPGTGPAEQQSRFDLFSTRARLFAALEHGRCPYSAGTCDDPHPDFPSAQKQLLAFWNIGLARDGQDKRGSRGKTGSICQIPAWREKARSLFQNPARAPAGAPSGVLLFGL